MVSAVRPLGSLSMARGCVRIDSGPDTAKIGSADRVEVHHARLLTVIGVRKPFPHGLGQSRKLTRLNGMSVLPSTADLVGPRRMSELCHKRTCRLSASASSSDKKQF